MSGMRAFRFLITVAAVLVFGIGARVMAVDEHTGSMDEHVASANAGEHAADKTAEHAGSHGEDPGHAGVLPTIQQGIVPMILTIGVVGVVFAILALKVWPTIVKGLDDRANKIRSEIEAAESAQQQAREALEQYQKNLEEARAEAQRMLDQAKSQQALIVAEMKAKAEAEDAVRREKATRDIESAKRAALNEIYAEASVLATSIASKLLQREVSAADQQRLVEQSLSELRPMARN